MTRPSPDAAAALPTQPNGGILVQTPVAIGTAVVVGALGAAQGGYFPTAWGWAALAVLSVVAVVLLVRARITASPLELAYAGSFVLLATWIGLSIVWSSDQAASVDELERSLVYVSVVLAAVFVLRRADIRILAGAVLAAIACISAYGLATRLFPDRLGFSVDPIVGNRLAEPLGYWNGLGLFAATGIVLAFGVTTQARRAASRVAAAAALPILTATLYFTFSRGAWLALAAAAVVFVALAATRLKLIAAVITLLPAPALAVWLASRSGPLTQRYPTISQAAHDGHRLALFILLLALLAGATALVLVVAERRLTVPRGVRIAFASLLVVVAVGALSAVFVTYGSPVTLARKAYHQFEKGPGEGSNLTSRLFSASSNGRVDLWHAAWRDYTHHPWLGSGAGSFEEYWYRHRPNGQNVRDAHGLYIETLAELGPVGLGLLACALVIPLVALRRAPRHPLVPALAAAYVAYLVHAVFDWDWEMPAVTVTALLCGGAILAAARSEEREPAPLSRRATAVLAGLLLVPMGFSFMALVGNGSMGAASAAIAKENWSEAGRQARRARFWAPWSPRPWQLLAEVELGHGNLPGAVADMQRAIAKDPGNWELWLQLSSYSTGRLRHEALRRTHELNPLVPNLPKR